MISDLIIFKENLPAFKEAIKIVGIQLIGSIETEKCFKVKIQHEYSHQLYSLGALAMVISGRNAQMAKFEKTEKEIESIEIG